MAGCLLLANSLWRGNTSSLNGNRPEVLRGGEYEERPPAPAGVERRCEFWIAGGRGEDSARRQGHRGGSSVGSERGWLEKKPHSEPSGGRTLSAPAELELVTPSRGTVHPSPSSQPHCAWKKREQVTRLCETQG